MIKKNLKLKFGSFFIALLYILQVFLPLITASVYAEENNYSWMPDGYKIYRSEELENGQTKYYLVPKSHGFHIYDEENKSFSFSPQMTYALYGVQGDGLIEDGSDAMKVIADYYDVGLDELTESLIYDYMMTLWDTSSSLSNSFAYSGLPDEDSFCFTTFDGIDMSNWFSYAKYWCYDLVGANDWYVALQNMFGWHNVYDSDAFNNYKNDKLTFALYNDDDGPLFDAGSTHTKVSQTVTSRWWNGDVAISGYNVVKFQSVSTSMLSSGTLIFDNVKVSTGLKTKLSDLFTNLADGAWLDILEYNDYKKIHTGETESIAMSWLKSPVEDITIENNNLIVNIPNGYKYKVGYYVDYLVYDQKAKGDEKFRMYRHYVYPETTGNILNINGNSIETKLPFTNCSLDGTVDNTLVKGIGFFGYGLNNKRNSNADGSKKIVAELAPSRTAGMGDISFITAYDYYCFDYPFKDNETGNYGYDFNIEISDYDCITYIVDDEEVIETGTEKIQYSHNFEDRVISNFGTYNENNQTLTVNGNYIAHQVNNYFTNYIEEEDKKVIFEESVECCEDCTCTVDEHCENCKEIDGVLKCTCFEQKNNCSCYSKVTPTPTPTPGNSSNIDDKYWKEWKEWVESCKNFIAGVPELFDYVFSWLPEPLVTFIITSIATGFGISVIKVILRRE